MAIDGWFNFSRKCTWQFFESIILESGLENAGPETSSLIQVGKIGWNIAIYNG